MYYKRYKGDSRMTEAPTPQKIRLISVRLCLYREHFVALHGFIRKTRATLDEDLALARRRQKELMR